MSSAGVRTERSSGSTPVRGWAPPPAARLACGAVAAQLAAALLAAAARGAEPAATPPGLVIVIGDGMGAAQRTVAGWVTADGWLAMDRLPVTGLMDTRNVDGEVTDSAAGATAITCGVRTLNKRVGTDRDQQPVASLADLARAAGMAVGLVSTTEITDATPAAVVAHVGNRSSHGDVAQQYLDAGTTLILGGGRRRFEADDKTLPAFAAAGYRVITSREVLLRLRESQVQGRAAGGRILGLFSTSAMPYLIDGDPARPALEELAEVAVRELAGSPRGFVLLVEGARIDHACHDNDLAAAIQETLELDRTVALLLRSLAGRPNTLIVVTADHETGGLVLGRSGSGVPKLKLALQARHSLEWLEDEVGKRGGNLAALLVENWGLGELKPAESALLAAKGASLGVDLELALLPGGAPQIILASRQGVLFATGGHTAAPVPVTAWGAGAEAFAGPLTNAEVGQRLMAWLRARTAAAARTGS